MIYNTTWGVFLFIPALFLSSEISLTDNTKLLQLLTWDVARGILLTGVVGYLINIALFIQMKLSSPLTSTVSGIVKGVLQTLIGWLLWRNEIQLLNAFGIFLTLAGSSWYSYLKYEAMQHKNRLP
eukprot:TRINITY_DN1960_c0_g1_i13.p2 TRINITY_DN1960_c0_g1~~TRINITY_DN1960_c0_g1_i13.p2  ORF type:complete len:125 (+),score=14.49 TRINITY_DN1960_c0_g1_i13:804-1178(+)